MDRTRRICTALMFASGLLLCTTWPALAQTSSVEYVDRSSETGISMTGTPTNAANLNVESNANKDLLISRWGDTATAWQGYGFSPNGAPTMSAYSISLFPAGAPSGYGSGYAAADFDNDGWVDFFYCEPNGGAKLYRNMAGTGFQNWTTTSGLSALQASIQNARSCAWGDYDGDGFLDLAITVSTDDYDFNGSLTVFHNNHGTFNAIALTNDNVGRSPLWADFTGDGKLDLIVLDSFPDSREPAGYADRFFVNQGDGTFVDDAWNRIGQFVEHEFQDTIAAAGDVDNDGDIDVVSVRAGYITLLRNNGSGYFTKEPIVEYENYGYPNSISILDYDLDGYLDVLSTSSWSSSHNISLFRGAANGGFTEVAAASGFNVSLGVGCTAPGDYNYDGFTDVYCARQTSQPFFYKARTAVGYVKGDWVGIHLESQHGANNATGVGAVVKVTAGTTVYTQIVDGRGGYAGQNDRDLSFGLGAYTGTVNVEVRWPNGHTQTVAGLARSQYHTVSDDSPVINDTQIVCTKVFHEDGKEDWVFTWYTYATSTWQNDRVIFNLSEVPTRCQPPYGALEDGLLGVDVESVVYESGMYKHQVTLLNTDCEARCSVPYVVESGFEDCKDRSAGKTLKTQYCVQMQ